MGNRGRYCDYAKGYSIEGRRLVDLLCFGALAGTVDPSLDSQRKANRNTGECGQEIADYRSALGSGRDNELHHTNGQGNSSQGDLYPRSGEHPRDLLIECATTGADQSNTGENQGQNTEEVELQHA